MDNVVDIVQSTIKISLFQDTYIELLSDYYGVLFKTLAIKMQKRDSPDNFKNRLYNEFP